MKRLIVLLITIILLTACGGGSAEFTIIKKEYNDNGGKSTVRITMDDPTDEEIEKAIKDLYTDEFFGSASIHAYIHEPKGDDYGVLIAMAKYARSSEGLPQVGVDEIDTVYVEWQ